MKIAKLALITALLGTALLIILALNLEPKLSNIIEIDESDIGNYIRVSGEVSNLKTDKLTRFDISDDSGTILVISFDPIELSNKDNLEIIGKIDTYKGKLEIIAQEIKKVKKQHQ